MGNDEEEDPPCEVQELEDTAEGDVLRDVSSLNTLAGLGKPRSLYLTGTIYK